MSLREAYEATALEVKPAGVEVVERTRRTIIDLRTALEQPSQLVGQEE